MTCRAYELLPFITQTPPEAVVFGESNVMQTLRSQINEVAGAKVPILICGESGAGKDVIARMIHGFSPRRDGPFVKINCPSISGTMIETELFGCEGKRFTNADATKRGRIEVAQWGTLLLEEISELDLVQQGKLFRLLQNGEFCCGRDQQHGTSEARLLCTTNRRLHVEIGHGTFRPDLYACIKVVTLCMPPLRDRRVDIVNLVDYFLDHYNRKYNRHTPMLSLNRMADLQQYDWPGNIRELENLLKRYVILGGEETVGNYLFERRRQEALNPGINLDAPISLKALTDRVTRELESKVIAKALHDHCWNRRRTARALSISYRSLLYKIRDAGLSSEEPPKQRLKVAS